MRKNLTIGWTISQILLGPMWIGFLLRPTGGQISKAQQTASFDRPVVFPAGMACTAMTPAQIQRPVASHGVSIIPFPFRIAIIAIEKNIVETTRLGETLHQRPRDFNDANKIHKRSWIMPSYMISDNQWQS